MSKQEEVEHYLETRHEFIAVCVEVPKQDYYIRPNLKRGSCIDAGYTNHCENYDKVIRGKKGQDLKVEEYLKPEDPKTGAYFHTLFR